DIAQRWRKLQYLSKARQQGEVFPVRVQDKPFVRHPLNRDLHAIPGALHAERWLGADAIQVNRTEARSPQILVDPFFDVVWTVLRFVVEPRARICSHSKLLRRSEVFGLAVKNHSANRKFSTGSFLPKKEFAKRHGELMICNSYPA